MLYEAEFVAVVAVGGELFEVVRLEAAALVKVLLPAGEFFGFGVVEGAVALQGGRALVDVALAAQERVGALQFAVEDAGRYAAVELALLVEVDGGVALRHGLDEFVALLLRLAESRLERVVAGLRDAVLLQQSLDFRLALVELPVHFVPDLAHGRIDVLAVLLLVLQHHNQGVAGGIVVAAREQVAVHHRVARQFGPLHVEVSVDRQGEVAPGVAAHALAAAHFHVGAGEALAGYERAARAEAAGGLHVALLRLRGGGEAEEQADEEGDYLFHDEGTGGLLRRSMGEKVGRLATKVGGSPTKVARRPTPRPAVGAGTLRRSRRASRAR